MTRIMKRFLFWSPPLLYLGLIFYLSSLSRIRLGFEAPDFLLHFPEYFLLLVLLVRAVNLGFRERVGWLALLSCSLFSVVYAASDEIHQYYVPGRDASVSDFLTDAAGVLAGVLAILIYQKFYRRRSSPKKDGFIPDK